MDACPRPDKVVYGSHAVADNAAWLHRLACPGCDTIHAYPCGDHWHIGHATPEDADRCRHWLSDRPRP